jgi:hypothetical protein
MTTDDHNKFLSVMLATTSLQKILKKNKIQDLNPTNCATQKYSFRK